MKHSFAAGCLIALTLYALSAAPSPLDDLKDCAQKMSSGLTGVRKLADQCPGLDATLEALAMSQLLDADERQRLNSDALRDLVALSAQYSVPRPAAGPSSATLAMIAAQVNGKKIAAPLTWWDRLKAWVQVWFAPLGSSDKNWFDEWVRRLSDSTAFLDAVLYICMGIVILGALWVVFMEMRAAGILQRGETGPGSHRREPAHADVPRPLADGRGGVQRLLSRLVYRLIETRRLQFERTLTHRELVARSVFDTAEQRSVFAQVSQAAESLVYGGAEESAIAQPVIERGDSLLAQLTDLPATETR